MLFRSDLGHAGCFPKRHAMRAIPQLRRIVSMTRGVGCSAPHMLCHLTSRSQLTGSGTSRCAHRIPSPSECRCASSHSYLRAQGAPQTVSPVMQRPPMRNSQTPGLQPRACLEFPATDHSNHPIRLKSDHCAQWTLQKPVHNFWGFHGDSLVHVKSQDC